MILTSVSSVVLILASFLEASPTSVPSSQSFDKLLDSFIALEIKRTGAIKKAEEAATSQKSNMTLKFLEVAGNANYVLKNIRLYFDAGKIKLDFEKGESNLSNETVISKTFLLRVENNLNGEMYRLAKIYKNLEAAEKGFPQDMLSMLRPLMDMVKQSEQAVIPLERQLQVELKKAKKKGKHN